MKQKKLHIIFLDFDDIKNPLLGAGQARATVEVGKRLVKMRHKVTVICNRYPGYIDRTENGLVYTHIGINTNNIRLNNFFYILSLPFTVRTLRADIIIECFTAPISTMCSQLFTKIPVVGLPTSFEADRFSKLYHLPVHLIENFGLKTYKYFLPYTKHLENKMKAKNPQVISQIIPEGVDEIYFSIPREKPEYILFLGRYDMGQKGIDLLLHAYKKVEKKLSYPLRLVGIGPDKAKIEALIQKLNLQKKVTIEGPAYGKEKFKLLSHALFVAFSSRHEGFSLFSLEALASGNPLVGFAIPGLSWADEKAVLKAPAFNISHYANLLVKASEKVLNKKMSRDARVEAGKYTWDAVAEKFAIFFTFVLANERGEQK